MNYLDQAVEKGYASFSGEGKKRQITYEAVNHSERYSDPEEQVRAKYWAELIFRYGYEPARIGVEVTVPDRTPSDRADLVVYRDDERKRPFAVIECKRDGITDAEFAQAVEQVVGNATWAKLRADYVGVVAGETRRFLDFSGKIAIGERETNIIADLPKQYGPLPDPGIQDRIAKEYSRRRLAARRLREEAGREWEAAKACFEEQLLGEEAAT